MNRLTFWIVTIIAASVLFLGVNSAGSVTGAIAKTAGSTAGLIIGGIPTFVGSFKSGMTAGNTGAGSGGGGSNPGTSWQGITGDGGGVWGGNTPQAPKQHTAPAKQHKHKSSAPV